MPPRGAHFESRLNTQWHRGFFEYDGWLLDQLGRIRHLPTVVVHGRYDVVCPPASAFELSKELPRAKVEMVADSGHSAWEPGTTKALVEACAAFQDRV